MNRTRTHCAFLLLGLSIAASADAKTEDLRLMCTVEKSSDASAQKQVPRPKDLITIEFAPNGDATINSKLHNASLTGTVTEHDISAMGRGSGFATELYINRYTTEYRYQILYDDPTRAPAQFFGSCQKASKSAS